MPTKTKTHIDRALTSISLAYMQDASMFVCDTVFPRVPVQKQSDLYFIYKREDFFRDEAQERADGTESAGGDYEIEQSPPYYCRVYAYHKDVTEQERVNSDDPLMPDQDATEFVAQKLLLRREVLWAQTYFKKGVWGTDLTGVSTTPTTGQFLQFDQLTSDPIKVITEAGIKMAEETSYRPNVLVMGPHVYNVLKNHEDILDRIKYTQKGIVTTELLATLFEVDKVVIPWAVQNTSARGVKESNSFITNGKGMLLCYSAPSPGIKRPSAGYTFTWTGYMGPRWRLSLLL